MKTGRDGRGSESRKARVGTRVLGSACVRVWVCVHTPPPARRRAHARTRPSLPRAQERRPRPRARPRARLCGHQEAAEPGLRPACPERLPSPSPTRTRAQRGRGSQGGPEPPQLSPRPGPEGPPGGLRAPGPPRRGPTGPGFSWVHSLHSWHIGYCLRRAPRFTKDFAVDKARSCFQNTIHKANFSKPTSLRTRPCWCEMDQRGYPLACLLCGLQWFTEESLAEEVRAQGQGQRAVAPFHLLLILVLPQDFLSEFLVASSTKRLCPP
ncbi:uncharacterized protein LOC116669233 [Camelus ferus]|uniref:Uncharacterized protein LOC116669233 n=1 Tax=Camelus ferus TaxID=419612 RepID=A0A8B8UIC6_CAMFR|nr:uncharacterized protein LOC116669233 [Camelus ferus]